VEDLASTFGPDVSSRYLNDIRYAKANLPCGAILVRKPAADELMKRLPNRGSGTQGNRDRCNHHQDRPPSPLAGACVGARLQVCSPAQSPSTAKPSAWTAIQLSAWTAIQLNVEDRSAKHLQVGGSHSRHGPNCWRTSGRSGACHDSAPILIGRRTIAMIYDPAQHSWEVPLSWVLGTPGGPTLRSAES
jgi:hypothetical protein